MAPHTCSFDKTESSRELFRCLSVLLVMKRACGISPPYVGYIKKKESESLLMTPLAWMANLVIWLVTGLIWYKVFQALLPRG
jgi:ammonia channel protein AmtB